MGDKDGFDARLRDARTRNGLQRRDQPKLEAPPKSPWGFGMRAGVEIVSALVVGVAIGYGLDRWLGTWPWLFLVMFVVGSAAGVMNVYRLILPAKRDK